MSDFRYDPEQLEIGDSFEGGPIEMGYFISAISAVGGKIQIDGNTAIIVELPHKTTTVAPEPVVEEVPEPMVEEASEPVVEETPEPVAEEAPEPVAEEAPEPVVEVEAVAATPAPVKRGRKPAVKTEPTE